jgi:hypothetical protein
VDEENKKFRIRKARQVKIWNWMANVTLKNFIKHPNLEPPPRLELQKLIKI